MQLQAEMKNGVACKKMIIIVDNLLKIFPNGYDNIFIFYRRNLREHVNRRKARVYSLSQFWVIPRILQEGKGDIMP